MFKCKQCKKLSQPGEKANKKVLETRNVTYQNGSHGTEIVCRGRFSTKLVKALGTLPVFTQGTHTIHNSMCIARGSSVVHAFGKSRVVASDNSNIIMHGYDTTVHVFGNASVIVLKE